MGNRLGRLVVIAVAVAVCGCCERRVWRCPDGQCGILSGRFDGCNSCTNCEGCGELLGHCRCHPFVALKRRITCGEGCGEIYWDEWHSDPPAPCDPCDEYCGTFIGSRCCPPPWLYRTNSMLVGRRCCGDCGGNCGGACESGSCGCTATAEPDMHAAPMPTLAPERQPAIKPSESAPADNAPSLQESRRGKTTRKTT